MALPSNRSSSPSFASGRTSPNSRNTEIGNSIRRSFSGNPFSKPSIVADPRSLMNPITPANGPSDYPRRNLFTSRDNEEKENGKDQSLKPVRVRSPTVGKSTKHFMSPTISAASKIAVSPKKKILGDRNEPVRSSLSFSGMKSSSSLNSANPNPEASTTVDSDANSKIAPISNPITMAVETDIEAEIAPISEFTIAAAPSKASNTVRFGGFEVISDSHGTNPEIVTMADEDDMKPEIAPISNSVIETAAPKASKTVRFAGFEVISDSNNDLESPAKSNLTEEEVDCVNLDPSFKISPDSSPMVVAPLDADPSIPPYDPRTNYLSPRPQFLHYRPNRRINQSEPDCKLDELFSESEFIDESDEASSNESQMEEEEGEEEIINVSEPTPIEAKKSSKQYFSRTFKISSLLLILFAAACFSLHVVNVHDPDLFERGASLLTMEDPSEIYEFARSNFNVLVGKLKVWQENSMDPSEIYEFARLNFDVLVGKLEVWQEKSISFISNVVSNLRSGGPPLIYLNQTEFFYNDVNADGQCLVFHQNLNVREIDIVVEPIEREGRDEEEEEEHEQESLQEIEDMKEIEIDIKPVEREYQNQEEVEEELFQDAEAIINSPKDSGEESLQDIEVGKEKEIEIEPVEIKSQNEEVVEEEESFQAIEIKFNDPKENDETSAKSSSEEESFQENTEEETSTDSASDELNEEDDIQEKQTEENYEDSSSSTDFKIHDQIEQETETGGETEEEKNDPMQMQQSNTEFQYQLPPISEPQSDVEEENSGKINLDHGISRDYFTQNTAVVTIISAILLGLSLIIPAGVIYARKSRSKPLSMAAAIVKEQVEQQPLLDEKKTNQSPVVVQKEEEEAIDDDDMAAGEFSSSETSSFQYSSMKEGEETEEMKRLNEVQSHGRKMMKKKNSRRESMASSSLDEYSVSTSSASPSYGSFTTYEKIPIKHVNGDDEIMTPVRRSSRIRKQHN